MSFVPTKEVDLIQMLAETTFPTIVAIRTFFLPYLSATTNMVSSQLLSCGLLMELTTTQPRTNDTLAETEKASHHTSEKNHIPVFGPRISLTGQGSGSRPQCMERRSNRVAKRKRAGYQRVRRGVFREVPFYQAREEGQRDSECYK